MRIRNGSSLRNPAGHCRILFSRATVVATLLLLSSPLWGQSQKDQVCQGPRSNRGLHSAAGSLLSPQDTWMTVSNTAEGIKVQALESGLAMGRFPQVGERDKYLVSRDGRAMASMSALHASIYANGNPDGRPLELANFGVHGISAMAATRDGFVIGNGDGILGVVSGAASTPRAFATDMIAIDTIAVSSDGRFIAAGTRFGAVEVWEVR